MFINNNNFTHIGSDPTKKYQRAVRASINRCPHVIRGNAKWGHVTMNPTSPHIRGLLKVHKPDSLIRPAVNWTNAPAYKLAKHLVQFLAINLPLPYAYNIKNTVHLINDLGEISWNENLCMALFHISNMYTNIPTDQLPSITNILCNHYNIDSQLRPEILHLCKIVLSQNYFTFRSSTYQQNTGLAMGAPTSSIFLEIYL
jgi:hypothetical protein